ncbi:MAG: isoprenylcysteine carboxylmethyltransferase family protein [Gammaproteobacteria bacterium]|nr:isoprenylcysteine carboxylmethyltransferase family protein [Gammaproteobacteria bacterium]
MTGTGLIILKVYLLTGLIFHKALWEVMKRRQNAGQAKGKPASLTSQIIKLVKLMVLAGIVIQTILPDILPISNDPQTIRLTGLFIFTLGLLTAIAARVQLGNNWSDIEDGKIANKHAVVSSGIYGYIRHPIYTGDILLLIGLELCLNSWLVLGVVVLAPVVAAQAIREEKKLINALPDYEEYTRQTKRFIPFLV